MRPETRFWIGHWCTKKYETIICSPRYSSLKNYQGVPIGKGICQVRHDAIFLNTLRITCLLWLLRRGVYQNITNFNQLNLLSKMNETLHNRFQSLQRVNSTLCCLLIRFATTSSTFESFRLKSNINPEMEVFRGQKIDNLSDYFWDFTVNFTNLEHHKIVNLKIVQSKVWFLKHKNDVYFTTIFKFWKNYRSGWWSSCDAMRVSCAEKVYSAPGSRHPKSWLHPGHTWKNIEKSS